MLQLRMKFRVNWSSNRTFMELKCEYYVYDELGKSGSNRTFMELKFNSMSERQKKEWGSNRTFMELKWCCSTLAGLPDGF